MDAAQLLFACSIVCAPKGRGVFIRRFFSTSVPFCCAAIFRKKANNMFSLWASMLDVCAGAGICKAASSDATRRIARTLCLPGSMRCALCSDEARCTVLAGWPDSLAASAPPREGGVAKSIRASGPGSPCFFGAAARRRGCQVDQSFWAKVTCCLGAASRRRGCHY